MNVQFTKQAKKDAELLEKTVFNRIKTKLKWYLNQEKPLVFAERLTHFKVGEYRYRIGEYRVIFDVKEDMITINRIGHRREIYR